MKRLLLLLVLTGCSGKVDDGGSWHCSGVVVKEIIACERYECVVKTETGETRWANQPVSIGQTSRSCRLEFPTK